MGRRPGQRVGPQRIHWRPTPLGQAIEQARYEKHLTLKELAAAAPLSLRTVKAIVAGEGNPGSKTTARLSWALFGTRDGLSDLVNAIAAERGAAASKGANLSRARNAPLAIAKGATRKVRAMFLGIDITKGAKRKSAGAKGATRSQKARKRHQ